MLVRGSTRELFRRLYSVQKLLRVTTFCSFLFTNIIVFYFIYLLSFYLTYLTSGVRKRICSKKSGLTCNYKLWERSEKLKVKLLL